MLSEQQRSQIMALATDFPRLWRDPNTPDRERKRMLRLLVEDVTVLKGKEITAHVRFKGGATKTLMIPRPVNEMGQSKTSPEAVAEIDRMLDHHGYREIAAMLNVRGFLTGTGRLFSGESVAQICRTRRLKSRYNRLREAGFLTSKDTGRLRKDYSGVASKRPHSGSRMHRWKPLPIRSSAAGLAAEE